MGINLLAVGLLVGGLLIGGVYFVGYTNGKNACATANIEYNNYVQKRVTKKVDSETIKNAAIKQQLDRRVRELKDAKTASSGCISADQLRIIRSLTR